MHRIFVTSKGTKALTKGKMENLTLEQKNYNKLSLTEKSILLSVSMDKCRFIYVKYGSKVGIEKPNKKRMKRNYENQNIIL